MDIMAIKKPSVYALSRKNFNALASQHPALTLAIIENIVLSLSIQLRLTISALQAIRR
jgi:CRP-like cAMP-binding protein